MLRWLLGCALALWLSSYRAPCAAQAQSPVRELGFDLRRDLAYAGTLGALYLVAEVAWPAPSEPRWTHISDFDLRAASALGLAEPARADRASDALLGMALVGGPALAFFGPASAGRDAWPTRGFEDLVIMSQAVFATGLLTQIVKQTTARVRPAVHFREEAGDQGGVLLPPGMRDSQRFVSFWSAHAALSASVGASLVTLSYLRGYSYRHAAAAVFAALSLAAGSMRVLSGWHWTTDVLAGWAVGTAFGVGVPLLHEFVAGRRTAGADVQMGPGPRLQLSWVF
jgi:hypothetical protein